MDVKRQEEQRQIHENSLKQMKDTNKYVTIWRNNNKLKINLSRSSGSSKETMMIVQEHYSRYKGKS
jgi:hypothetical protein